MDQGTMMNARGVDESVTKAWEQELEDILSILGLHNYDTGHHSSCWADDDVFIPDGSDQIYPVLPSPVLGEELHLLEDSGTFPPLSFCQSEQVNAELQVTEVQNTSQPAINGQFNGPILPLTQPMEIDLADLSKVGIDVRKANAADNINKPIDIASVPNPPCQMIRAESTPHVKKRKPTTPIESPNKLFGILSLILQAFNSPLTEELEECYTGALQRALKEIQSAVALHNSLRDNKP